MDSITVRINKAKNDSDVINVYQKFFYSDKKISQSQKDSLLELIVKIGQQAKNKNHQVYALFAQGKCYESINESAKAIEKYMKCVDLAKQTKNESIIAPAYNRIAYVHRGNTNDNIAIKYFHLSISYALKNKDSLNLSENFNALGTIYKDKSEIDSALFYHNKALEIRIVGKDKKALANTLNNIGLVYKKNKNYAKALEFLNRSMVLKKQSNDKKQLAGGYINIGNVHLLMKDYNYALAFIDSGITIAGKNNYHDFYLIGLKSKPECLGKMKRFEESSKAWEFYEKANDSLKKIKEKKELEELEMKYESVKKDAELKIKEEQLKSKSAQNAKQRLFTIASVVALIMALIAVFFIYRSYRQNKRNARELALKNHLIEEKSKEITDSINYARLIQQSLLASKTMLDKNLNDYFVFYKPKDIVSGDFYWGAESQKGFLIACVDCTGHGVPGAFMSLIGKENLDKAVAKTNNPAEILSELNNGVKRSLNQNEDIGNKDGMDAVILRIEKLNDNSSKLFYSGANRPLYVIRKNSKELIEVKATKQAIGGFTSNNQVFEQHELELQKGDSIFISTDGYADQFGSNNNKKLTTKRFKELLVSIQSKSASEQKQSLEDFFTTWKGNFEQLDDLLVIGINI